MKVPMRDEEEDQEPELGFFSYLFMAIGALICILSGTCMLIFTLQGFREGADAGFIMLMWSLLFGGIPFGVGLVMFSLASSRK